MFCTGGVGTGKSFLLKAIVGWLCLCHAKQPGVVTEPFGVAARNVWGHTLYGIFRLPVQHGYEPDFHELPACIQCMFQCVHTIIIDEISMVSSKYFHYIHQRLCSIAKNDLPFGGVQYNSFWGLL